MTVDRLIDILTIIFGAGGILSFLLNLKRAKSQNTLDLSDAWEKFSAPLMARLEQLEKRVIDQEVEITDLRGWAERLVKQVIELGGEPVQFVKRRLIPPTKE